MAVIDDDRDPSVIWLRQPLLLGEAPRHRLDLEALMRERHAGAPAERAEPPLCFRAGEIVERDRHAFLRDIGDRRSLWPAPR
jgi:hypothetical protein